MIDDCTNAVRAGVQINEQGAFWVRMDKECWLAEDALELLKTVQLRLCRLAERRFCGVRLAGVACGRRVPKQSPLLSCSGLLMMA